MILSLTLFERKPLKHTCFWQHCHDG